MDDHDTPVKLYHQTTNPKILQNNQHLSSDYQADEEEDQYPKELNIKKINNNLRDTVISGMSATSEGLGTDPNKLYMNSVI